MSDKHTHRRWEIDYHYLQARAEVQRYVDHLQETVWAKRMNESAIYRLVEGYLEAPGYSPEERRAIFAEMVARNFAHSSKPSPRRSGTP